MEDILVWLFWAVMIGGSIASSASKAKKKREEEAKKAAAKAKARAAAAKTATATAAKTASATAAKTIAAQPAMPKSAPGGTFGRVLEELSRQLSEQPAPTATSHDYRSLEQEYNAMDGREYRGDWSAESLEDEVTAYERLAEQRASRSSHTGTAVAGFGTTSGTVSGTAFGTLSGTTSGIAAGAVADAVANADDDGPTTLQELLDGDFDLRRAVIEAEILTPKYAASY